MTDHSTLTVGDRMRLCPHRWRVVDPIEEIIRCDDCGLAGYSSVPLIGEDEKRCGWCREVKPLTEFARHSGKSKGVYYACRLCTNTYQREGEATTP